MRRHIDWPITPVPMNPTRVDCGVAFFNGMFSLLCKPVRVSYDSGMPVVAPRLREPIVLVHGLLGFDALRVLGRPVFNYFPGIAEFFQAAGNRVYSVQLTPTAGVAQRAIELRDHFVNEVPDEPVHVIAHSMGGLDSRYMISRLDM